jgi:hypothetical protein
MLRRRREELNVYRGRTLSFVFNRHGTFGLDFLELPAIQRSDVILPEADLNAIEQHTIGSRLGSVPRLVASEVAPEGPPRRERIRNEPRGKLRFEGAVGGGQRPLRRGQ